MKYFFSGIAILMTSLISAQSFVGVVDYRGEKQYAKLSCENEKCQFSLPYLDGRKKYDLKEKPTAEAKWKVDRGFELWEFNTAIEEKGNLVGELHLPTGNQEVKFRKQLDPIKKEDLAKFEGTYADEAGRKVIVYSRFDYLHMVSPYSEQTVSLKPIEEKAFWSVSNERSYFDNLKDGRYLNLYLITAEGEKFHLFREDDYDVEEHWINVFGDSIYAKLYLPPAKGEVPACLLLPGGGGAEQMENFEYEARYFATNGIAAMTFDKVGVGKSSGENSFEVYTFEEKARRYQEIFHYLAKQENINVEKIGVHGPSEGGRLSLMMAQNLPDSVAFVIATAAPLMTMKEGQLYAANHYHRNLGVSEVDNILILNIWKRYYDGIIKEKIDSLDFHSIRELRSKNERLFLPPTSTAIPRSPMAEDLKNDRVVQDASKIKCPVLLQYGENDQRVDPYTSLRNFYSNVEEKQDITPIIYNRGNHSMMTPEFEICKGYLSDKLHWFKKQGLLN